jgi:hypothetical protein
LVELIKAHKAVSSVAEIFGATKMMNQRKIMLTEIMMIRENK